MTEQNGPMVDQGEQGGEPSRTEFVKNTLDEMLSKADVKAVYGTPIHQENSLIIPAAEVMAAAAVGAGEGQGPEENGGGGSGAGGGGRSFSRPVAVIIAGPEGVRVEPVLDITKIGLAALTTAGFMLATMLRMRYPNRSRD